MNIVMFLLTLGFIGLDQLTKWLAVKYLMPVGTMTLIPGLLGFRYVENTGAAFSFFSGKQVFLIIITSVALLVLAYIIFIRKTVKGLERFSLVMILAGGIGNLIDRIAHGYVVDFFEFLFMEFAVFNIADCLIVVGVALLALALIRQEIKNHKDKKREKLQEKTANGNN